MATVFFASVINIASLEPARAETGFDGYGDIRFRLEADWDSKRSNGIARDDRVRARLRLRAGFTFKSNDNWEVGARIRTGSNNSQQSPHITIKDFSGNNNGDQDINFNQWYAKYNMPFGSFWLGRKTYPFWKQNDLFWTSDVTPTGAALSLGRGEWQVNLGYFGLPAGMRDYSGNMGGAQLKYQKDFGSSRLILAGGYLNIDGDPDDEDGLILQQGNSARDYELLQFHAKYSLKSLSRPLALGIDFSQNLKSYDDAGDAFALANRSEKTGYVLSANYGDLKEKNHWLLAYYYAHIEALAVNNSYSQDDWMRWGSRTQVRGSSFKGHEIRFAYAFSPVLNVVSRLYLVENLTSVEDGKRFRADLNYKF